MAPSCLSCGSIMVSITPCGWPLAFPMFHYNQEKKFSEHPRIFLPLGDTLKKVSSRPGETQEQKDVPSTKVVPICPSTDDARDCSYPHHHPHFPFRATVNLNAIFSLPLSLQRWSYFDGSFLNFRPSTVLGTWEILDKYLLNLWWIHLSLSLRSNMTQRIQWKFIFLGGVRF